MWMRTSAERSTSSGRPAPSLPTRRAMGWHQSTSQGARKGALVADGSFVLAWSKPGETPLMGGKAPGLSCTLEARVWMPATLHCVRRMARDIRSEERRVGKEGRSGLAADGLKKKGTEEWRQLAFLDTSVGRSLYGGACRCALGVV